MTNSETHHDTSGNAPKSGLTRRQQDLLEYIRQYTSETGGVSPSAEEMRIGLGLASKAGIQRMIDGLEERGHITRLPKRARSIRVVE